MKKTGIGNRGNGRRHPDRRSKEERNALVLQWQYLPSYVVANKLQGSAAVRNLGREDAVQTAFLGLIRAAEIWDETRGVQFKTYAVASIINYVTRTGMGEGLVKIPHHSFNKKAHPSHREAASRIRECCFEGVENFDILDYRNKSCLYEDDNLERVQEALKFVTERFRVVIIKHYFQGKTFRQIGEDLGVKKQRAQQLFDKGIKQLRRALGLDFSEPEEADYEFEECCAKCVGADGESCQRD